MQLASYLAAHDLTDKAFADRMGVDTSMVTRWRRRETMPKPKNMRAIVDATDGAVTANDFHTAPDLEPAGAAA